MRKSGVMVVKIPAVSRSSRGGWSANHCQSFREASLLVTEDKFSSAFSVFFGQSENPGVLDYFIKEVKPVSVR